MTATTVPTKTPLGEEELRRRTLRLGQRHRTILLLVDGHRPLDEVLSLASKAGAASSHLDELVKLGLVMLPAVEAETQPQAKGQQATHLATETAPVQGGRDVEPERSSDSPAQRPVLEKTDALVEAAAPPLPAPAPRPAAGKSRGKSRRKATAAASASAEPLPAEALQPAAKPSAEKRRRTRAQQAASTAAGGSAATDAAADEGTVQQVRDLLLDTLRLDSPLFSARMLVKVRGAQSANELINLVWEIETHLRHDRRSRDDMQTLQQARDLLGMGNTRVKGESQAGALDE